MAATIGTFATQFPMGFENFYKSGNTRAKICCEGLRKNSKAASSNHPRPDEVQAVGPNLSIPGSWYAEGTKSKRDKIEGNKPERTKPTDIKPEGFKPEGARGAEGSESEGIKRTEEVMNDCR
jgi:hypothetical protein